MSGATKVAASHLGADPGHGRVTPEAEEPTFHAGWEGRVFALTLAMGATGSWTLDESRRAREDRSRVDYVAMSYYELWLAGLERLLDGKRLTSSAERRSGQPIGETIPVRRVLAAIDTAGTLSRGASTARPARAAQRFHLGDPVRTATIPDLHHTRLPNYAQGNTGVITAVHGCHVFPDTNAHGEGEQPQWLYTVEFSATELFGPTANPNDTISVDAFEPYLDPA